MVVRLRNKLTELEQLHQVVEDFSRQHGLSARVLSAVSHSLEEILTNIVSYAYEDSRDHQITVSLALSEGQLELQVEDDGRPFNPEHHPSPDTSVPLEDKPVGGLGIHIVRTMMDEMKYRRESGKNVLVLKKKMA